MKKHIRPVNKFKSGDFVTLTNDRHNTIFQVFQAYESGYSLVMIRTGIVLPNIIDERKLTIAHVVEG